ncbi:HTH-type transcriptional regulator AdhR [Sarcina ventriculi]|uniref:MerR family transcriptional regulator n=1 Tax=Sarcina ventriculi TaxID=1267 RepID=UPI000D9BA43A|nr:MerR family transcriptional regulator [Sarcina ventriculi]SPZ50576.1 HTH-type transcriptional regulator AdhR [Sarcina ventriculi]
MYTMNQTCEEVGMNYETLKFYCNEGLIPNVKRNKNNHRIFDENDIEWIKNLSCLKNCGMTINDMKIYINLCLEGESTILERKTILDSQKHVILDKIKKLQESVNYINQKQQFYDDVLDGKINYYSNLIKVTEK